MSVNKKWFYLITLFILLISILSGCTTTGCSTDSLYTPSISGVISVPVTGQQHYETDDFADDYVNFTGAQEISYDDTAHGTIGTSGDVDCFSFSGTAGDTVIIDIDAESFGSRLDSVLTLYNGIPSSIAYNDDYPPATDDDPANYIFALDSHIEVELPSSFEDKYYISVESYGSTYGSYQLRLFLYSSGAASAHTSGLSAAADFAPGEIIVKYRPGFSTASVKSMGQEGEFSVLKSNKDSANGALELLRIESTAKSLLSRQDAKKMTLDEVRRLRALPYVEYAEPNYIMKPTDIPNDNYIDLQWHYPLIKLDMVWEENLVNDVSTVRVAVIDTGIARSDGTWLGSDHPDLDDIFVDEYDFIRDDSLDGDGIDSDATDPGDDPYGLSSSFHGTHVIGTIGALTHNGTGIAGVAGGDNNGVRIIPVRALGAAGGTVYDIAQAILYAAGQPNLSPVQLSSRADIINMSLGAPVDTQTLRNAVDDAYDAGVLIVASAGNEGSSTLFYPAAYDNVISVSAVGPGGELAPYSSYGATVDISAPGGDLGTDLTFDGYPDGVLSTLFDHDGPDNYKSIYSFYQGTSMAAPHVSGVAALVVAVLRERAVTFTPNDIRNYMINNVIDLGQPGKDIYYGHGLVNAYNAVIEAKVWSGTEDHSPVLYPFPRSVKLEGSNPTGTFTLKNIGREGTTITIDNITVADDPENMVVTPITFETEVNAMGQEIGVTLDTTTTGIENGRTYHARLLITYDTSKAEYVYILYNSEGITSMYENEDIGNIFVVAIDPVSYKTVAQDVTTYSQNYIYNISGLPPGSYVIAAGTDRDSDLGITDAGEAIGLYPVYGTWMPIDIVEGTHLTGIDFQVTDNISAEPGSLRFTRNTASSD